MRLSLLSATLLGLLYYPLQQIIFFARFSRFNSFQPTDIFLPITGIFAFLLLYFFLQKTPEAKGRTILWALFIVLGIPLSLLGSMGGGLFGPIGMLLYGLIPVVIVLLLGKGIAFLARGK